MRSLFFSDAEVPHDDALFYSISLLAQYLKMNQEENPGDFRYPTNPVIFKERVPIAQQSLFSFHKNDTRRNVSILTHLVFKSLFIASLDLQQAAEPLLRRSFSPFIEGFCRDPMPEEFYLEEIAPLCKYLDLWINNPKLPTILRNKAETMSEMTPFVNKLQSINCMRFTEHMSLNAREEEMREEKLPIGGDCSQKNAYSPPLENKESPLKIQHSQEIEDTHGLLSLTLESLKITEKAPKKDPNDPKFYLEKYKKFQKESSDPFLKEEKAEKVNIIYEERFAKALHTLSEDDQVIVKEIEKALESWVKESCPPISTLWTEQYTFGLEALHKNGPAQDKVWGSHAVKIYDWTDLMHWTRVYFKIFGQGSERTVSLVNLGHI